MIPEPAFHIVPKEPEPDRIAALEARVLALEIFMGMAPVHPDVSPVSPEVAPKRPPRVKPAKPQSEQAKAIAAIFRRKPETKWGPREIIAFEALGTLDMSDLLVIANFYESERAKGTREDGSSIGFHRHSLGTFLNNYFGELDKARNWAARHAAAARKPLNGVSPAKAADVEPARFRAEFDEEYPRKAGLAWKDLPPEFRRKYL